MNRIKAKSLVLEDGSTYGGFQFGGSEFAYGEVVFNTSMTVYQEILTDPSYAGQIVVSTYPIIGNYGVNDKDFESDKIQVSGFVVREYCDFPSHNDSNNDNGNECESRIAMLHCVYRGLRCCIATSWIVTGDW